MMLREVRCHLPRALDRELSRLADGSELTRSGVASELLAGRLSEVLYGRIAVAALITASGVSPR